MSAVAARRALPRTPGPAPGAPRPTPQEKAGAGELLPGPVSTSTSTASAAPAPAARPRARSRASPGARDAPGEPAQVDQRPGGAQERQDEVSLVGHGAAAPARPRNATKPVAASKSGDRRVIASQA